MPILSPSLLVAVADHAVVVKVTGRANFTTSVTFKRLVNELCQRGYDNLSLDLSDCASMDSTFLGVLAGTALRLSNSHTGAPKDPHQSQLRLFNASPRVAELLDNLGIADLFRMIQCDLPVPGEQNLTAAAEVKPSREELSRACLEAHQLLMSINPQNVAKFKEVTQFLAEDLKRLGAAEADSPAPVDASHSHVDTK